MRLTSRIGLAASLAAAAAVFALNSAPAFAYTLVPGYTGSTFVTGGSLTGPDPIVINGHDTYLAYQNVTSKTGGDGKSSTVVHYHDTAIVATYDILGHCDGLRQNPLDGKLWATVNEDGNPVLYVIDPVGGTTTSYLFSPDPATTHGGGFDDILFTSDGTAYIAHSAPTHDPNSHPALSRVTLVGTKAKLTTVLMGNAPAKDIANGSTVTLNLQDPDSLTLDPQGDIVLVDQGDSQVIFVRNPGKGSQAVFRLSVGTQLDDTIWAAGPGRLFVVDGKANATYILHTDAGTGTLFTSTPNDSSVPGIVGTVAVNFPDPTLPGSSPSTLGNVTPVGVGFSKPTGLWWVPDSAVGPVIAAATPSPSAAPGLPTAGSGAASGGQGAALPILILGALCALGLAVRTKRASDI